MRPIDADMLPKYTGTALSAVDVARAVENAPTIDPVKRGKWEDVEADEGEWICFKCSECGHDAYSYTGEIMLNEWKFCPYCGARMDKKEDEDEHSEF